MCVWSFPSKRSYRRILGTIERKTDVVTIMATGCPHNTIFQLQMLLFLVQISPGSVTRVGNRPLVLLVRSQLQSDPLAGLL